MAQDFANSGLPDLVVVAGAPGTGKSTLCRGLRMRLGQVPVIEFSALRQFLLDDTWGDQSPEEEQLAWSNLVYCLRNYVEHGFRPVIVTDLRDHRVQEVPTTFGDLDFRIVTLVAPNEVLAERIKRRVVGFSDERESARWNDAVRERALLTSETQLETNNVAPDELVERALEWCLR